ncbi:MAG: SDR family NAD(P)-dependent oxidoreductase [Methylococcaceae bacterium]|nr:SDR family NAD(P)-dependent oxidoreductase [Methylococcaceae bacterium]
MTTNKIAVITGASQGIGKAIALGLAEDGYQTILIARSHDKLLAVAEEITQINPALKPELFALDILQGENIKNVIQQIQEKYQGIDVFINNAGVWLTGSLGVEKEKIENLLATNFIAPYLFIDEVSPFMKQQGAGYIINISSRSGKIGFAGSGLYSASKFALNGLSESLYKELAPFGIKVTNICPSWVNTEMAQEANSPLNPEDMIQPQDIVTSLRYLLNLSAPTAVKELLIECTKTTA